MLPETSIDRDSPVPFYFQLAELLEHEIAGGRWKPGVRLPSELDLCGHFSVSRTTLRQALSRLEQEGLVSRHKGRGTFVEETRPRSWLLQSSGGFFEEEVERMGRQVTSSVRRVERGPLPGWARDALELPRGQRRVTLERVRSVDGLIAMYVVNHLPERLADAVLSLEEDESLYQRLREHYDLEAAGGRRVVEALPAEELLGQLLEVSPKRRSSSSSRSPGTRREALRLLPDLASYRPHENRDRGRRRTARRHPGSRARLERGGLMARPEVPASDATGPGRHPRRGTAHP